MPCNTQREFPPRILFSLAGSQPDNYATAGYFIDSESFSFVESKFIYKLQPVITPRCLSSLVLCLWCRH